MVFQLELEFLLQPLIVRVTRQAAVVVTWQTEEPEGTSLRLTLADDEGRIDYDGTRVEDSFAMDLAKLALRGSVSRSLGISRCPIVRRGVSAIARKRPKHANPRSGDSIVGWLPLVPWDEPLIPKKEVA